MQELRRRLFGAALSLLDDFPDDDASIYTIVAPKWAFPGADILLFNPRALLNSFATNLRRAGLSGLGGWAICFVDNEYDPVTRRFQPHIHVVVVGEKCQAFEALRDLKMFKGGNGTAVRVPIQADPLRNPARQLSYLLKTYVPERSSFTGSSGATRRNQQPRRIAGDLHELMMLKFASWRLADLAWFSGVSIVDGRLKAA